jgi:uncharacterized protein (TIGR00369 family)
VIGFDGVSECVTELQHEPRRPKLLDLVQAMLKGDAPLPPIAQLIGFKLTSVTCGQAVIEFQAGEQHANPMGILHGGVFCDIADAAMGIAYASTLEEGETLATLKLKINFLKPIWQAKLHAIGNVVHKGHTVGLG